MASVGQHRSYFGGCRRNNSYRNFFRQVGSARRICRAGGEEKDLNPKGSFGDELLDFMYAGKKLRKWYGEEGMVLPKDGGQPEEEEVEEEPEVERDQVLVLDADTTMGELVVLQLILTRQKIKALVKDAAAASAGFGPYIQAVQGTPFDTGILLRALRGVRTVICCGKLGTVLPACKKAGVKQIVLLSAVGSPQRGFSLFGGEMPLLADAAREQQVRSSGMRYTIVQVGGLSNKPSGSSGIAISAGESPCGEIGREDVAQVLARAATSDGQGDSVVVQVQNVAGGDDWELALDSVLQSQTA